MRRFFVAVTGFIAAVSMVAAGMMVTATMAGAAGTVKISGKTFRFGKRYPVLINALVRVREYPDIWALSDQKGDYELTVPDDANVTPYIVSGWNGNYKNPLIDPLDPNTQHYNSIDLQTFHTRGEDIVNANFQTPTDFEYNSLKALLKVKADANGRPQQCVIVTTSSARNVRGVSYDEYWDNTPHGVAGATSRTVPGNLLPSYFNDAVLPDPNQTSSSHDGGIIWATVPTGTYRVITEHPTTRFASFLATCAPGRVVNANPPWGAYELSEGEQPLAASNVAASLKGAKVVRKGQKRLAVLRFEVGEAIGAKIGIGRTVNQSGFGAATRKLASRPAPPEVAGIQTVKVPLKTKAKAGRAKVTAILTDASGISFTYTRSVKVPKLPKKSR